ncbi:hypothetical protein PCE1_003098 [Barthelona sp. PCE]
MSDERMKFIDIGANLCDPQFHGIGPHGRRRHPDDFQDMLDRCVQPKYDVTHLIITSGCLKDLKSAVDLVKDHENMTTTIGCHPTRSSEVKNAEQYFGEMVDLYETCPQKFSAIGEFGLDYDRLFFADEETQKRIFDFQFGLAEQLKLPMFLHSRNCHNDFIDSLRRGIERSGVTKGVVHSFTGSIEEYEEVVELGMFISLNGCSLKTEENCDVVRQMDASHIMLETDCRFCEIKKSHYSHQFVHTKFNTKRYDRWQKGYLVKNRNEPCKIIQVAEVVSQLMGMKCSDLAGVCYDTTKEFFNIQ